MKSKRRKKRKKPASDKEALWPADLLTDAHNDRVIEQLAKARKAELIQHHAGIARLEKDNEQLAE